jgi:CSLREA domain-containing protein
MKTRPLILGGLSLLFLVLVGALLTARPVNAAGSIQVTTTADDYGADAGSCSLREAITAISTTADFGGCTYGGADTMSLTSGATYTLTRSGASENSNASGDLDVYRAMTITANGNATISASGLNQRVLDVFSTASLTIVNVTLRDGVDSQSFGGGIIRNAGVLSLTDVTIMGGSTGPSGFGGGVYIYNPSGYPVVTMTNSTIRDNNIAGGYGGGIAVLNGQLTLIDSSVVSNSTAAVGGGIFIASGNLTLKNTTISHNSATDVTSDGGGIYISAGMINLNANNVTLAENSTQGRGGGIFVENNFAPLNFSNTLVAGNAASSGPECYTFNGALNSLGSNLVEDTSDCTITGTAVISNSSPLLLPLDYYTGPTLTHAIEVTSPAKDVGGSGAACEATDQRGWTRPAPCDIGAFEYILLNTVYLPLIVR